ncbi:MAG: hypothetical protein OXC07_12310 [Kistimonas sp.]|nr:hypothetical protein [Kistimonas sp.]
MLAVLCHLMSAVRQRLPCEHAGQLMPGNYYMVIGSERTISCLAGLPQVPDRYKPTPAAVFYFLTKQGRAHAFRASTPIIAPSHPDARA